MQICCLGIPKLAEADTGHMSCNRQIKIQYINDKKAVEISPQSFLYLNLILIEVNSLTRYSMVVSRIFRTLVCSLWNK